MRLHLREELRAHSMPVTSIDVRAKISCPSGTDIVVSGSKDKRAMMWEYDVNGGTNSQNFRSKGQVLHDGCVTDVTVSRDASTALTASTDGLVRAWNLRTGASRIIADLQGQDGKVLSVALTADKERYVSTVKRMVRVWKASGDMVYESQVDMHTDKVLCVGILEAHGNKNVISCDRGGHIKISMLSDNTIRSSWVGHSGSVCSLAVHPSVAMFATGGSDKETKLWNPDSSLIAKKSVDHAVNALSFCPTRPLLAIAADTYVKILDTDSYKFISERCMTVTGSSQKTPPCCRCIAWSSDGGLLFVGYSDYFIRVFQLQ